MFLFKKVNSLKKRIILWFIYVLAMCSLVYGTFFICTSLYTKFILKNTYKIGDVKLTFRNEFLLSSIMVKEVTVKSKPPIQSYRTDKYFCNNRLSFILVVQRWEGKEAELLNMRETLSDFPTIDSLKVYNLWFHIKQYESEQIFSFVNYRYKISLTFNHIFGNYSIDEVKKLLNGIHLEYITN